MFSKFQTVTQDDIVPEWEGGKQDGMTTDRQNVSVRCGAIDLLHFLPGMLNSHYPYWFKSTAADSAASAR